MIGRYLVGLCFLLNFTNTPAKIFDNKSIPKIWSIETHEDLGSEIDLVSFHRIISEVFQLYQENNLNRTLELGVVDWETPYFSAWATENSDLDTYQINFWGGYARLPDMTKRSFILTACHEVGHILGSAPFHLTETLKNMSAEGQADFFAAAFCMKRYYLHYGFEDEVEDLNPYAAARCYDQFGKKEALSNELEFELCLQVAKAGQDLSQVLTFLKPSEIGEYHTPSPLVVEETNYNGYPDIQCRLDTYLAGALRATHLNKEESGRLRPACWFSSQKD